MKMIIKTSIKKAVCFADRTAEISLQSRLYHKVQLLLNLKIQIGELLFGDRNQEALWPLLDIMIKGTVEC